MTDNYYWEKIAEYLATEVLGWEWEVDSGMYGYYHEDGVVVGVGGGLMAKIIEAASECPDCHTVLDDVWRPHENMNHAFRLAEECDGFSLKKTKRSNKWECTAWFEGSTSCGVQKQEPEKAICIAVLGASGADISEFTTDKEETRKR